MSLRDDLRMNLAGTPYESIHIARTDYHGLDGDAVVVRLRDNSGTLHDLTMFVADKNKVTSNDKATLMANKVRSFLEGTAE